MALDAEPVAHKRLGYRPPLDGLRGVAVLLVLFAHVFDWPPGGGHGVDIFFVLSGFLITTLLLEERIARGSISLRRFYARRALRLLPALVATILAYLLVVTMREILDGDSGLSPGHVHNIVGALLGPLYLENILAALDSPLKGELVHLWTLATEEQFYVLWPAALVMILATAVKVRRVERVVVAGIVLVMIWRFYLGTVNAPQYRLYGPDVRFDPLFIGCLLGIWFVLRRDRLARLAVLTHRMAPAAVLFLLAVVFVPIHDPVIIDLLFLGLYSLIGVASGIVVFDCVLNPRSWIASGTSAPWLVAIGRWSYSIYLWHIVVIIAVTGIVQIGTASPNGLVTVAANLAEVGLSLIVAYCSYKYIESPFLRRKRRFEPNLPGRSSVPLIEAPAGIDSR